MKMEKTKTALCLAVCLSAALALPGCGSAGQQSETAGVTSAEAVKPVDWAGTYFDTVISLRVYGDQAEKWVEGAVEICQQMELTLSAHKEESELYQVNHRESDTVEISEDLAACIDLGLAYSEMSEGAFDITIFPVKELWDFESEDHKAQVPDADAVEAELSKVDYRKVHLEGQTLTFDSTDTMIDLGGIAKGYISQKLNTYLREQGCQSALINLGGNVSTIGCKPDGSPWVVGIQKPFSDRGEILTTVQATDQSVISSGIYERYFELDGKLYHHILDPRTGYPCETDLNQLTVIGSDDAAGDALATIGVILGKEKIQQLVKDHDLEVTILFTDRSNEVEWFQREESEG